MPPNLKKLKFNKLVIRYLDNWDVLGILETYAADVYRMRHIMPGFVVVDIGAGIGDFTLNASRIVGSTGKVISIEPNKKDFEILIRNIRENRCENVIPLNIGIGDSEKEVTLCFKNEVFSAKLTTLRLALNGLNVEIPDFVKMDVEGFERDIIETSLDVINSSSFVSMELHGDQTPLVSLMKRNGFDYLPLSQKELKNNLLSFVLRHPIFSMIAYVKIIRMKDYSPRRFIERIDSGFSIIDEGKLSVGLFSHSDRMDLT